MKYSDILGLQEYFHPIFNIENETANYWKQFIPNEQFYDLFRKTITAFDSHDPGARRSIWIQGTFGTGKSHAASVIKHLLWDGTDEIADYVSERFDDPSLKAKLNNFRNHKKLLPIIIKGVGNITDHRTFALQIESSVKNVLHKLNIDISVSSDFDRLIDKVNNAPIDWNAIIQKYDELNILVNNRNDILKKLIVNDIGFFRILEDTLSSEDIHFSHAEISLWLSEVNEELISRQLSDGIIIFWDEFTSVMDTISSGSIDQIQHIAELSEKNNIFLYLISHRTPNAHQISQEDRKRMNDRFHIIQYRMEPITTYHIISATIKKKDTLKWEEKRNDVFLKFPGLDDLITKLTNNHSASAKAKIKDLFPIHPYSAFLSTFIARNLGSTNRSIFEFLYDNELGFLSFLNKEMNGNSLLTVDLLWDFFVSAFEDDSDGRFNQVLDKYKIHILKIKDQGENYIKVFKGILLLNVLYKVIEVNEDDGSPVTPSTENITSLYIGNDFYNEMPEMLAFIDEKGIITKTPAGDFLIEFSSLPIREIENEKESARNQFKDIINVLKYSQVDKEIEKSLFKDNIYRESEISLFSSHIESEHILRSRISKSFSKSYSLKVAVFLPKDEYENQLLALRIKNLVEDEDFQDIIFIFIDEPFKEKNFDKFIDYLARKQVSENHKNDEQSIIYDKYAKDQVREWSNRIKTRYVQVLFQKKNEKHLANKVGSILNKEYSLKIYSKGIDNIPDLYRNANLWKFQTSIKSAEIFIFSDDRNELEEKTASGPNQYLRYVVRDIANEYIINDALEFKPDIDNNHSLKLIQDEVDNCLNKVRQRSLFNIGDELKSLTNKPFGIYTNMPNMAIMGYVMRKYIGELYMADVGRPIQKDEMRDLVGYLFSSWQDNKNQNKLNVRFGSKEERELKSIILQIFDLKDSESITDARWLIRDYLKTNAKFPLWSLKYHQDYVSLSEVIEEIIKLVSSLTNEIDIKLVKTVLNKIKDFKFDLKLAIKPQNFRSGFFNFLINIDSTILITEEDFPEVIQYLYENMQEEVGLWKEEKVKNNIFTWFIHKTQPAPPIPPEESPTPEYPPTPPPPDIPEIEKRAIIKKVKDFTQGEDALKSKILTILEENPGLLRLFDLYFS